MTQLFYLYLVITVSLCQHDVVYYVEFQKSARRALVFTRPRYFITQYSSSILKMVRNISYCQCGKVWCNCSQSFV